MLGGVLGLSGNCWVDEETGSTVPPALAMMRFVLGPSAARANLLSQHIGPSVGMGKISGCLIMGTIAKNFNLSDQINIDIERVFS
jgi:hypothetical protein